MGNAMVQAQLPALAVHLRVIPDREARWFVRTHHYLHRALHADMRGEAEYTTPPIATMVHEFRLRPIYELRRPDAETKEAADD